MKVASYFELKNVDYNIFNLWLETLPLELKRKSADFLWERCSGRKAVLWMERGGFRFF